MPDTSPLAPVHTDSALLQRLRAALAGFHGTAGVYVRQLASGASAGILADDTFPTASLIKLPFLLTLYDQVRAGKLDLRGKRVFRDSLRYVDDEGIVSNFRDGAEIPLGKLVWLMITLSDNNAATWIQWHILGGKAVNSWLAGHGYTHTRVNSRVQGRETPFDRWGWGQTSPREMAELLLSIRQDRVADPAACEEMYRILTDVYWDDEALSQIPPTVQVASKQGMIDRSRSEVLLVNAPHGDYVLSVMTRNQTDTRWEPGNEGYELIRRVSRLVYRHFEPGDPWRPPEGMEPYRY